MLVDTDILIWSLRGDETASTYIDSLDEVIISDVTYMELVQGTKSKKEFKDLIITLESIEAQRLVITDSISLKAVELVEQFAHSHSMQLADALIAATAIIHNLPFASGNKKHFEHIPSLELHIFKRI